MYINGKWIETDKVLEIKNPANGDVVDTVFLVEKKKRREQSNLQKQHH